MANHTGRVIVCAGSATGIGAETASRLAAEGAKIMIGDVNIEAAEAVVKQIRANGGEAAARQFNITDEASVSALFASAADRYGRLDAMHANAADMAITALDGDAVSTELDVFDRTLAINLRGHLLCTRVAIPLMQQTGGGAIVYTSSAASKLPTPRVFSYGISKAGLNALMRHVALRWGKEGIRANAVLPGVVRTEAIKHSITEDMLTEFAKTLPSPRFGEVRDIAALVSFLLSAEAEWINGQAISIDGGVLM